jgi:hypothetical protein
VSITLKASPFICLSNLPLTLIVSKFMSKSQR